MTATEKLSALQEALGHRFSKIEWLEQALTHKSFANESDDGQGLDNERFEFLGDAVLDLALSETLMVRFAQDSEGALSKKRASLVNEEVLAKVAQDLNLVDVIRLGRGEMKTGGVNKPRILASSLEAVFGAIFLDGGFEPARGVVEKIFASRIHEIATSDVDFRDDFKTRLQERVQEKFKMTPAYRVEAESGPDHDKKFEVSVRIGDRVLGQGAGRSKKAAEQEAARQALEKIT